MIVLYLILIVLSPSIIFGSDSSKQSAQNMPPPPNLANLLQQQQNSPPKLENLLQNTKNQNNKNLNVANNLVPEQQETQKKTQKKEEKRDAFLGELEAKVKRFDGDDQENKSDHLKEEKKKIEEKIQKVEQRFKEINEKVKGLEKLSFLRQKKLKNQKNLYIENAEEDEEDEEDEENEENEKIIKLVGQEIGQNIIQLQSGKEKMNSMLEEERKLIKSLQDIEQEEEKLIKRLQDIEQEIEINNANNKIKKQLISTKKYEKKEQIKSPKESQNKKQNNKEGEIIYEKNFQEHLRENINERYHQLHKNYREEEKNPFNSLQKSLQEKFNLSSQKHPYYTILETLEKENQVKEILYALFTGYPVGFTDRIADEEEKNLLEKIIILLPYKWQNDLPNLINNILPTINKDLNNSESDSDSENEEQVLSLDSAEFFLPKSQERKRSEFENNKIPQHRKALKDLIQSLELTRFLKTKVFDPIEKSELKAVEQAVMALQEKKIDNLPELIEAIDQIKKVRGSNNVRSALNKIYTYFYSGKKDQFKLVSQKLKDHYNTIEEKAQKKQEVEKVQQQQEIEKLQKQENEKIKVLPSILYSDLNETLKGFIKKPGNNNKCMLWDVFNGYGKIKECLFSPLFQELALRVIDMNNNKKGEGIIGMQAQPSQDFSSLNLREQYFILKLIEESKKFEGTYWNKATHAKQWRGQIGSYKTKAGNYKPKEGDYIISQE